MENENYTFDYNRVDKDECALYVSGVIPSQLNTDPIDLVIPRNLGSRIIVGVGPHLLRSEVFAKRIKSINFPDTTRFIGPYSFFRAGIKKLWIPSLVNTINDSAFSCSEVEEVIFQGNDLKVLDSAIFCSCTSLKSINLPKELRYINEYCFNNCPNLKSIVIPPKVVGIKINAFTDSGIETVFFEGPVPIQIHSKAFSSKGNKIAYVKKEHLENYQKFNKINKFFKDILPIESKQLEFSYCGNKAVIVPKIGGNNENIYTGELIIPESIFIEGRRRRIVGVDQFAFFDCSLERLIIPKKLNIDNAIIDKGIEIIRE